MNEMQKSFIQNGTSFLMHYNHKHDKLGRFAETNGSSRLASKIDKRNEKIDKIDKELSSVRENKKLAKYARFNAKVEKANAKAEKAMRKLAKGKALSNKEIRRLEKYEELKSKQASISEKESRIKDKRATLELEKSKLERKNEKTARKLAKEEYRKERSLNKYDAVEKSTDDYEAAKNVFDSLSENEKKSLTSNGQYSDSEYLVTRHVSKTRDGKPMSFAEIERDPENSKVGYLSTATKKEYRGSGFSKNAIDKALTDANAKGIKQVYWETTKSNTASSSLAKKMGFKPTKNFSKDDDNYVYDMSNFSKDKKARDQVSWANAIIATGYGNADDIAKAESILEKERKRNR